MNDKQVNQKIKSYFMV